MSYLKNNKVLLLIISAMLVVNIGLLYYVFLKDEKREHRSERHSDEERLNMMKEKLRSEVGFTDAQLEEYVTLRKQHFETIRPLFDELRQAKDSMFQSFYRPGDPDSLNAYFGNRLCEKQQAIDFRMINYFRRLRSIASDQQKPAMDSFLVNMTKRMVGGRRK